MSEKKIKSNWWFLLPIVFGLIGGIIAYFILRNNDSKKAKNCLYLGIILAIIGIILNLALLVSIPGFEENYGFEVNV